MIFKQIGMNIRFLRKKSKMSQLDLAKELSITRQQVANYEKGDTSIPFISLYKISTIFNISIDNLISDTLEQLFISDIEIIKNKSSKSFLQKRNVRVSHKEITGYFIMHFDEFMEDELIKLKISNLVKDGVIEYLEENVKSKK